MTTRPPASRDHGTGIPVKTLRADVRDLAPEDFEDRHGSAFLLLTATELRPPRGPMSTHVELGTIEEPAAERTATVSLLAYPLRRTERSVGHLVTLGRTGSNDVVIPDVSVSRFHAFLKPAAAGGFQIQDAGSTNGTTVNGRPVPPQGAGPPLDLKAGDNLRLGQVELTFLDARALREFLLARYR